MCLRLKTCVYFTLMNVIYLNVRGKNLLAIYEKFITTLWFCKMIFDEILQVLSSGFIGFSVNFN